MCMFFCKTEAQISQHEVWAVTWLSCKYINSTLHIWLIVIRIKCSTQIRGCICVCDLSNRHKLACSCFILTIWTHLCPSFECEKKNKLCHELKSTKIRKLIKLIFVLYWARIALIWNDYRLIDNYLSMEGLFRFVYSPITVNIMVFILLTDIKL